jgi:lipopolysaccharide/colanic/teichoic acid biosynthesis glycosyltransferase
VLLDKHLCKSARSGSRDAGAAKRNGHIKVQRGQGSGKVKHIALGAAPVGFGNNEENFLFIHFVVLYMNSMTPALRPRTLVLFLGDIVFFVFSLWLSLFLRAFEMPSSELFMEHLRPFSLLFVAWVGVFFIAGLYESRSIILERRAISATLLTAQVANVIIAALFFFFIPIFGIAPKTLLVIYLVVSFLCVFVWRVVLFPQFGFQKKESALVVGAGAEIDELVEALRLARHAPARIAAVINPGNGSLALAVKEAVAQYRPRFIIADFSNGEVREAFPELYNYLAQGIRFFDALTLYEEVFGRVPLSVLNERWVADNVSRTSNRLYDMVKRVIDIVIALPAALISLLIYPFIIVAQKLQDGGAIFYTQYRTGKHNKPFLMVKFRSMSGADQGNEVLKSRHVVTPVGRVIRKTRLDELPQLWSVVKGEMSLIGPRPEFPAMVEEYTRTIPYYGARHLVKPGLSGWAQLYHDNHPHHGTEVGATREKLSYDLYYLKHRSLTLDATIILKTIKKLLTRSGI